MVSDNNLDSVRETRELLEQQANHEAWRRRFKRLFVWTSTLLAVGLAVLAFYAYSIAHRTDGSTARLDMVEQNLNGLNQDVKNADARLGLWDTERDQLRQQLEKTGNDILHRADAIRKQTGDAVDAMARKIQARTDGQVNQLQTKISALESAQDSDRAQVAGLQKELGQVRGEVAKQGDALNATRGELNANGSATQRQLVALKDSNDRTLETARRNQQDVDRLNNSVNSQATERVDFEVAKGHVRQITPEIQLNLTGIDLPFHRATGWMWVMPDRRTIWLRKQSVQEPVIFYGHDDGKKRELVITDLTKNSMVGYLVLPKGSVGASTPAAQ